MTPADKITAIEAMKAEGKHVLMVGDGLNDTPALAAAHASLAPTSAADISRRAADAVFQGNTLLALPETLLRPRAPPAASWCRTSPFRWATTSFGSPSPCSAW
jgi:P-type E1-E2 ATPase